jgi:hypothetical protein
MKHFYYSEATAFILVLFLLSITSCAGDGKKGQTGAADTIKIDSKLMEDFSKSKLIFYSLPSPLETAMLIKKSGVNYNEGILNPLSNVSRYTTNRQMALNLGIYSADLSYTSLFDQTQTAMKYMGNTQKLAEGLGIMDAIDKGTLKKLEENMNNRDVVMEIISEAFMNSNSLLNENDRPALAVMVLTGGWVEGLYIATTLTNGVMDNNKRLLDKIIYQKLSLYTVLNMLDSYKAENADIQRLYDQMSELKVIYDEVKIVNTSNVEASTDKENRMTVIKADSETFISKEVFEQLCKKVKEIRTEFIS